MEPSTPAAGRDALSKRDLSSVIALQQKIAAGDAGGLHLILDEAVRTARASGAMFESAGKGEWVCRGAAGCFGPSDIGTRARLPALGLKRGAGATACRDTLVEVTVDRDACARVGARSIAAVPLRRNDAEVFVLT